MRLLYHSCRTITHCFQASQGECQTILSVLQKHPYFSHAKYLFKKCEENIEAVSFCMRVIATELTYLWKLLLKRLWITIFVFPFSGSFGSCTHHDHVLQECRWCAQTSDVTEQLLQFHWNDASLVLPSSAFFILICRRSRERGFPTKIPLSCVLFSEHTGAKSPNQDFSVNHRLLQYLWNRNN